MGDDALSQAMVGRRLLVPINFSKRCS